MSVPQALIADRYRLVERVGSGGMGVVWEAWDERLERKVALKQLRLAPGVSEAEAELAKNRAMREARITARLHHRNAVPVFDVVEHEGQPCLIMQFVPSVPLSTVLRDGGQLSPHEAARVGSQIAAALAAAHDLGIVHRDIKPGNILISDDGNAMISDFGISHALGDATLTSTGVFHGTPAYLSPEVARGGPSSAASDVYSLGATLYATMEGSPPFGSDSNSIALLYRVASGDYVPPARSGPLAPLITEMLSVQPAARPAMRQVAAALGGLADGAATEALSAADRPTVALPVTSAPIVVAPLPASGSAPGSPPAPTTVEPRAQAPEPPVMMPAAAAAGGRPARSYAAASAATAGPAVGGSVAGEPPAPTSGPSPEQGREPRRRRGLAVFVGLVLLAGLVALAAALLNGQTGRQQPADPPPVTSSARPEPTSAPTSSAPTPTPTPRPTQEPSPTASPTPRPSPVPSTPQPTPSPKPTPTPKPSATPAPSDGNPSAADPAAAITTYYALVPGNTDQAWTLLTGRYQQGTAGGRASYGRFWGAINAVSVSQVRGTRPDSAEAVVTYSYANGRVVRERTAYRLVRDQGVLKIDSSSVVSSSG